MHSGHPAHISDPAPTSSDEQVLFLVCVCARIHLCTHLHVFAAVCGGQKTMVGAFLSFFFSCYKVAH